MDASFYVLLCCLVFVGDASGSCGSLTIMKPTFVDRNVTLKFIPRHRWIANIVWMYTHEWDVTKEHTVKGIEKHFQQNVEDGLNYHTMMFFAEDSRNNSKFHVQCSDGKGNSSTNTVKLHLHEIRLDCGNLVLLSPEIKYGTNVEIAYYPSDSTLDFENNLNNCTWLKGLGQPLYLRNDTFEERKVSDYLYTLNLHNFMEKNAGHYALKCGRSVAHTTNWLHINVTDKQLIGPIMDNCVYGNADTIIYCNTSRTTGKSHVTFSIGSTVITMPEKETEPGVYTVVLVSNTWRDNDGHIATCKISNNDYVHDLNSSAKLCYMEKGSDPILIIQEYIHDENTTLSCEVSNTRPPTMIEILVDNTPISNAVHEDLLNETSKTFDSKASILIIDKKWNGKEICCRKISTFYGNLKATCKTFNIKLQNDTMFVDCTTGEIDCLEGSSGNDTRTSGIRIEKKCPLNKTEATDNGIIKCDRTNASEDGSKPRPEYVAGDNSTRSFKLPLQPILVGIGAFVVVCIIVASARTLVRWSKGKGSIRNPDNIEGSQNNNFNPIYSAKVSSANDATHSRDTNECVEMPETSVDMDASHDLENDYVKLQTREDSMMARKPITAIKSKHAESSLIYADLDIDHLQKACVVPIPGPRPNRRKEATVYDDIDFSKTKSAGPH